MTIDAVLGLGFGVRDCGTAGNVLSVDWDFPGGVPIDFAVNGSYGVRLELMMRCRTNEELAQGELVASVLFKSL